MTIELDREKLQHLMLALIMTIMLVSRGYAMDKNLFLDIESTHGVSHSQSFVYQASAFKHAPIEKQVFIIFVPGDNIYRDFESSKTCTWQYTPSFIRGLVQDIDNCVFIRMCPEVSSSILEGLDTGIKNVSFAKSFAMEKLDQRLEELVELVDGLLVKGADPQRIFLLGHSFGGWVSLLFLRKFPLKLNNVIVSAPAMSQRVDMALVSESIIEGEERQCDQLKNPMQRYLCRKGNKAMLERLMSNFEQSSQVFQVEQISQKELLIGNATYLPALVYVYPKDIYNKPEDLEWLAKIPGVEFMVEGCYPEDGHSTFYMPCFAKNNHNQILAYIQARLPVSSKGV